MGELDSCQRDTCLVSSITTKLFFFLVVVVVCVWLQRLRFLILMLRSVHNRARISWSNLQVAILRASNCIFNHSAQWSNLNFISSLFNQSLHIQLCVGRENNPTPSLTAGNPQPRGSLMHVVSHILWLTHQDDTCVGVAELAIWEMSSLSHTASMAWCWVFIRDNVEFLWSLSSCRETMNHLSESSFFALQKAPR